MVEIRLATEEDIPKIIKLMQANKRDNLTEEQQKKFGFVQGSMTEPAIVERIHGLGVDVAVDEDRVVGAALTSEVVEGQMPGPLAPALELAQTQFKDGQFYFYGPSAVDADYRGQHLLTRILDTQFGRLSERFSQVAAFAEDANPVSIEVHVKMGFEDVGLFQFKDRAYHLLRRTLK